jgi:hypothetical protein
MLFIRRIPNVYIFFKKKKNRLNMKGKKFFILGISLMLLLSVSSFLASKNINNLTDHNGTQLNPAIIPQGNQNFPQYSQSIGWSGNGTIVANYTNLQTSPKICSTGDGGAIIVWEDERNDAGDIYAQKLNSNGDRVWTPDTGVIICDAPGTQENIDICSDGTGGAFIAWEDKRNDAGDIYAQRINSNGDLQWGTNDKAICNVTGNQRRVQVCYDYSESVILIWEDGRSTVKDIYGQKVNLEGEAHWDANGTTVCNALGGQYTPKICCDENGDSFITWVTVGVLDTMVIFMHKR